VGKPAAPTFARARGASYGGQARRTCTRPHLPHPPAPAAPARTCRTCRTCTCPHPIAPARTRPHPTCYSDPVTDPFLPLRDLDALEAALARAEREPIIIFKHSPTCGTSAQAWHDLSGWLATREAGVPAYLVDVRARRALSAAIAGRLGIRHESPQLLLVHGGVVRWHGSHWHVNALEVQTALEALTLAAQA